MVDSLRVYRSLRLGIEVLALNLREGPKWYHATVVQKLGINVYNVHIHALDVVWKRHIHQLLRTQASSGLLNCNSHNNKYSHTANPELTGVPDSSQPFVQLPSKVVVPHSCVTDSMPHSVVRSPIVSTNVNGSQIVNSEPQNVLRRSLRERKPVDRYGYDSFK